MMIDDYKIEGPSIYEDPVLNLKVYNGSTDKFFTPLVIKVYQRSLIEEADRFVKAALRSVQCYPIIGARLHNLAFMQPVFKDYYHVYWALDAQGGELDQEALTRDDSNMIVPQQLEGYEFGDLLYDSMRHDQTKVSEGYTKSGEKVILKQHWRHRLPDLNPIIREMLNLRRVEHPNVQRVYEMSIQPTDLREQRVEFVTVCEEIKYTMQAVAYEREARGDRVPEAEILTALCQYSGVLLFCKSRRVPHRDIRPECFYYGDNGLFKLSGFSAAYESYIRYCAVRTPDRIPYICPELRTHFETRKRHIRKPLNPYISDVFSLGLSLLYFCCLDYPGRKVFKNPLEFESAIKDELRILPYSDNLKALFASMLQINTELRATPEEVHSHALLFLSPSPPPEFQSQASFAFEIDPFGDFINPANFEDRKLALAERIQCYDEVEVPEGPDLFLFLNQAAVLMRYEGKVEEALEQVETSFKTLKAKVGVTVAVGLSNKAVLHLQLGRLEEAEKYARQSLEMRHRMNPYECSTHVNGYAVMSAVLRAKGDLEGAADALTRALAIAERQRVWLPSRILERKRILASLL